MISRRSLLAAIGSLPFLGWLKPPTLTFEEDVETYVIVDPNHHKAPTETDLLEFAWGIICNAGGGDWEKESKDWQGAAARFRAEYFQWLDKKNTKVKFLADGWFNGEQVKEGQTIILKPPYTM